MYTKDYIILNRNHNMINSIWKHTQRYQCDPGGLEKLPVSLGFAMDVRPFFHTKLKPFGKIVK